MKIYITRHGQVCPTEYFGNADFPMFDIPLSELGQKQAECIAKVLKSRDFKGKIYSSPYRRTMMTAEAIGKACNLPVFPEQALREILKTDEGAKEFEGMTMEQLKQEFSTVPENAMLSYPWWKACKDTKETVIERVSLFWRQCHIKRTVQIVPTVEAFVALGLLNLMPFDALLMLLKNLCKIDAQLPKNRHA